MDFVAFDTETTGIVPGRDAVLEIGAVRFVDGVPQQGLSELIDPQCPIPPGATSVNGITDDMVCGKPLIPDVLKRLADYCGDLPLVAHNATFDYKFLELAVKEHECSAPSGLILDTLALSRKIFPGLPNYRLGTLVQIFKFPADRFHRAEDDARYCGQLFVKLLEESRLNTTPLDVEELLKISGRKKIKFSQYVFQGIQLDLL